MIKKKRKSLKRKTAGGENMADIQTSITMVDKASPIISKMNKVLNTAVDNCN